MDYLSGSLMMIESSIASNPQHPLYKQQRRVGKARLGCETNFIHNAIGLCYKLTQVFFKGCPLRWIKPEEKPGTQ
jgi:hypothetical protein